jgi:hypothetical protein
MTSPPPSSLSARILPPEEWHLVEAIEPFRTRGLPDDPTAWWILVVERDRQIVGTCSLFSAMHWDCWWIDPDDPAHGIVLRKLLRSALELLHGAEVAQVYTGVEHDREEIARLLTRFGFRVAPGRLFMLTVSDAAVSLSSEA